MTDDTMTTTTETQDTAPNVQPPNQEEPGERMIPESRLIGLVKENASMMQKLKSLEEKLATRSLDGLSEMERLKAERESLTEKLTESTTRAVATETRLKRSAVKAHFGSEMLSSAVVDLAPLDAVDLDENGDLTEGAKAALKAWRQRPEIRPLFGTQRRPGNTPSPGEDGLVVGKDQYLSILADPAKTQQQKQAAHEAFLRSLGSK